MNQDLLLSSAKALNDDEAGGHGNRWGVFDDDVPALMDRWLGVAVNDAEVSGFGMGDQGALAQLVAQGEPSAFALLHTGQARGEGHAGLMALIYQDPGGPDREPRNALFSAFPFFGDGAEVLAEVVQITPRAVRMLDVDFWRVDTVVIRADEDVVIPIYVAEHLFENDWRPEVGQYVTGSLWLQAYATERMDDPAKLVTVSER